MRMELIIIFHLHISLSWSSFLLYQKTVVAFYAR